MISPIQLKHPQRSVIQSRVDHGFSSQFLPSYFLPFLVCCRCSDYRTQTSIRLFFEEKRKFTVSETSALDKLQSCEKSLFYCFTKTLKRTTPYGSPMGVSVADVF